MTSEIGSVEKGIEFIRKALEEKKIPSKKITKTLLTAEEVLAKIFNIPVTTGVILSLFIAIMVLSVGSPGVPGGNLVCIALLAPQIGVPAEAISLIMGLYPIVGMMQTCANVTGDAVVTTIAAKHEKLLDVAKFNS